MLIDEIDVHPENAKCPIEVTLEEIIKKDNDVQPKKRL